MSQPGGSLESAEEEHGSGGHWHEHFDPEDFNVYRRSIGLRNLIERVRRYSGGGSLLEVGFGSGVTARTFADMGYEVVAVDIELPLVEQLSRWCGMYPNLKVHHMDMFDLGFKSKVFAVAYSQGVLEHFPDEAIVRALQEQARVAETVIVDVPNHRSLGRPHGDERLLPQSHWRGLIKKAGLTLVEEAGRELSQSYLAVLPYALLSWRAASFWRLFGRTSIFVCRGRG